MPAAVAHAIERRRLAGRDPSRVGRRRAGDRLAAARPGHLRRGRARARRSRRVVAMTVDAVAVTQGPGLIGSLLVGVSFAKTAAWAAGKPLVARQSSGRAHRIALARARRRCRHRRSCSSSLAATRACISCPEAGAYQSIGRTRDDAAGEAYDKVAKLLGLGYPGGPIIDRLAADADPEAIALPSTRLTHPDRNAPDARVPVRLQLQRPENGGAASRPAAAGGARRRRPACRPRSPISRQAFRRPSSTRSSNARSPPRSGTTRVRSALPAASRRTRGCARPRTTRAPRQRCRCSSRARTSRPTTRR